MMPHWTKIDRPLVHKVYIDYCKAKSMFYMVVTFLCIVVMELVDELFFFFFEGVMLSYDIIISRSQVINLGPSALLFLY